METKNKRVQEKKLKLLQIQECSHSFVTCIDPFSRAKCFCSVVMSADNLFIHTVALPGVTWGADIGNRAEGVEHNFFVFLVALGCQQHASFSQC